MNLITDGLWTIGKLQALILIGKLQACCCSTSERDREHAVGWEEHHHQSRLGGDDIGLGCNFIVDWELPPPSSEQTGKKQDYIYASKCKCWYGPIFLWEAKQMFGWLPPVPCGIRRGEQVAASWSMLVCRQSQERKRMRVQGEVNKLRAEISRLKVRTYKGTPWRQTRAL